MINRPSTWRLLLLIAIAAVCPLTAHAQGSPHKALLSGYVRTFASYTIMPGTDEEIAMLEMRMRFKLSGDMSPAIYGELAYELAPIWRESSPIPVVSSTYQGFFYRAHDLHRTLTPEDPAPDETFRVDQNLDRAFISYRGEGFDLHAGRQPIAFGSARTINPMDVLAPYPFNTIAKEERVGVDAIRLMLPMGKMSEIDTGLVFGDSFHRDRSAAFMRLKGYIMETDIAVMAMRFRCNNLYGLDISRSIGGASAWLEAAHVFTNSTGNDYVSFSAGADYAFTGELYATIEYHRNGAGTEHETQYISNLQQEAYTDAGVYLLGRNYLIPGMNYQLSPLVGTSIRVIYNMDDGSALVAPAIQYNAAEDVYLGLGGYLSAGRSSGPNGLPTEFELYTELWHLSGSYYF